MKREHDHDPPLTTTVNEVLHVPLRPLGSQGLIVSAQGLGCVNMTAFHGGRNSAFHEATALATIANAVELDVNFFDTAWMYQTFSADQNSEIITNEELLGRAI